MSQNLYRSIVLAKVCDVTVTLSLIALSQIILQTDLDTILPHAKIC